MNTTTEFSEPERLRTGILFKHLSESESILDRMTVNSGSEPISRTDYAERAFVPKQDWRTITAPEFDCMQARDTERDTTEIIYIWKIPQDINSYFDGFRRSIIKYNDENLIKNLANHADYLRGRQKLVEIITYCGGGEALRVLGHYSRSPGLISSSIGKDGLFVGLHLDSWFKMPLEMRVDGLPNRLCINLGPETRYLTLSNLSLRSMLKDNRVTASQSPVDYVADYLEANRGYPITRLAIHAGEAYIAPTEIVIHDATTLGKSKVDVSFTMLGNFSSDVVNKIQTL